MKACFVGAGSIGKRHIRNFAAICMKNRLVPEIQLLRSSDTPLPPDIEGLVSRQFHRKEELDGSYDAVFITNPTHLHFQTLQDLRHVTRHFFIEKPLFESLDRDVTALGLSRETVAYVACPIRYTPVVMQARKMLPDMNAYSVRAICSSYLPDWRADADYRQVYSARRELGGGVCLDLIHEWDYLTDLFGFPESLYGMAGRFSHLEIDSDDLAVYIARYNDKLVELHLDYFGRMPVRRFELYDRNATWLFDIRNDRILRNGEPFWSASEDANEKYLREMQYFLDLYQGKCDNTNDVNRAWRVMSMTKPSNAPPV